MADVESGCSSAVCARGMQVQCIGDVGLRQSSSPATRRTGPEQDSRTSNEWATEQDEPVAVEQHERDTALLVEVAQPPRLCNTF